MLSTSYNLDNDPRLKEPRKRRMPDTSWNSPGNERPEERGIPEEVRKAISDRSDGICEFGDCEKPYTHFCHLKPHALGSGREVKDLVHGCRIHHKLYDDRLIRHVTWTPDGRPVFYDEVRFKFMPVKPLPGDRGDFDMPEWLLNALSKRLRRKYERLRKVRNATREAQVAKEAPGSTGSPEAPKPSGLRSRRKPAKPLRPPPGPPEGQVRERAPPYPSRRPDRSRSDWSRETARE